MSDATVPPRLRVVIGADKAGHPYMSVLANDLRENALVASVIDTSRDRPDAATYPDIARAAAQLVADGSADRALLVCHTGLGMAIAANKVPGIRAVTAHDSLSVRASVESNNAQVLALGQGVIGLAAARRLVAAWLTYRFAATSTAAAKVDAITVYENRTRRHLL
ncbi:RpiB/LacA/LacB family sugar-phosphate isomerase [Streptomyces sp. NEAU-YJ-81]|uniref:RpiB/LacA/LacB family sugar-phosphate isomerase n=1 Tax=Streptomyces sp. NEAU-YJ-81 TaxID=2820288 RepID=UPI001ABCCFF8|nr:RpiB/LacA/LacB family sugar-phosphate isomerase [Streptomyces sp. NEAU-YJ-81]MBO3677741.1 RpiB/LacA/LacB family sugar-phosphate isomerase [Streptomyces sp. NEAU-YJ-81]